MQGPDIATVLDLHTLIHDHYETIVSRQLRCITVYDEQLHPDGLRPDLDRLLHDGHDLIGTTEDVNNIHRFFNAPKIRIRLLPQHFLQVRIYRDDLITLRLQIRTHEITRTFFFVR